MEYFVISAKFVPLKYYTLSSQLQRLTSFSVGCSGCRNSVTRPDRRNAKMVYNIYLFMSYSMEDFKCKQYWKFPLILPMRFHFMQYLVNSIIFRVSHRLLYYVFIEADFEKIQNTRNIYISSKVNQSRM